jgi:hypothetical protein
MKTSGLKFLKGEISSSRNISHMLAVPKETLQAKYVQTEMQINIYWKCIN